jgi:hypothetical protein
MSFGPELPAGVVALSEPVDIWCGIDPETYEQYLVDAWNKQMPEGFKIKRCELLPDEAGALGKDCQAALYCVWAQNMGLPDIAESLKAHYGGDLLSVSGTPEKDFPRDTGLTESPEGWTGVSFTVAKAAQNGIGGWVRSASDWRNLHLVRVCLGRLRGSEIVEL